MHRTHIRGKLNLSGKEIVLGVFLTAMFFLCGTSKAQEQYNSGGYKGVVNLQGYDDRWLHYGFTIGINSTRFKIVQSSAFLNGIGDSVASVQSKNNPGFSLGFVMNLRLNSNWDLRLLPTVAFYDRVVNYTFKNTVSAQSSQTTFIELPLLAKFKSQRRRNSRMYVVGGIKPCIEAGAKKREKKSSELRTNSMDFCLDYGFGFDIYYQLFKFSPEIRISQGLPNMLINDPNSFSRSLNRLTTHTVTLYLHFE
jgi:hypothetical protein